MSDKKNRLPNVDIPAVLKINIHFDLSLITG
jgi:hypothetical protein